MSNEGQAPASEAPSELSAVSSRLALSLRLPTLGVVHPGSTVHPTVHITGDAHYERLTLRLVAESRVNVMGKAHWQVGVAMNATMGGPGGRMPITTLERLTFLDVDIPFLSSAGSSGAASEKKEAPTAETAPRDGVYEMSVPFPPDGQILPAFKQKEYDAAGASVSWSLQLEGVRKGWYRQNDKCLPPLETTITKQLKFDGDGSGGLSAEATLSCEPVLISSSLLRFRLILRPSSSTALHLLRSNELKPSSSLSRQIRTAPIANPHSGREFDWSALRIATGSLEPNKAHEEGILEWRGELRVPEGEYTLESKGLSVKYTLMCHLHSTIFAQAALHIPLAVFLPSLPVELSPSSESAVPEASGSALPPYQP
ncbi:hypothetical protein JCM10450v2_002678 [Rhodotorula kratochvilovae]